MFFYAAASAVHSAFHATKKIVDKIYWRYLDKNLVYETMFLK